MLGKSIAATEYKLIDATVRFVKLCPDAQTPTKHLDAACFDLYSIEPVRVHHTVPVTVRTGIAFEIQEGYAGFIYTRSGMGFKGIRAHLGVIDPDFRGEITIRLFMHDKTKYPITLEKGSRIAQIFFTKIPNIYLEEVEKLNPSDRGEKGYGSSGA